MTRTEQRRRFRQQLALVNCACRVLARRGDVQARTVNKGFVRHAHAPVRTQRPAFTRTS